MQRTFALIVLLFLGITQLPAQAGMLDPSFDTDGKVTLNTLVANDVAYAVTLQPDGKIILVGKTSSSPSSLQKDWALARLHPDGALDTTFNGGFFRTVFGNPSNTARAVQVQPDGKVVVGGEINAGNSDDFGLMRYLPNGTLDPSFGAGGIVHNDFTGGLGEFVRDLFILPNGKILACGYLNRGSNVFNAALVRYHGNGSLDSTFGINGLAELTAVPEAQDLVTFAMLPNGDIMGAGRWRDSTNQQRVAVVRFLANGNLDPTFGGDGVMDFAHPDLNSNNVVHCIAIQPDGKTLVGGYANTNILGSYVFLMARILANGNLDPTFGTNGFANLDLYHFVPKGFGIQADGRIMVGGWAVQDSLKTAVYRLMPNGNVDPSFGNNGIGACSVSQSNDYVQAAIMQPDGKMVLVGYYYNHFIAARFFGGVPTERNEPYPISSFLLYPNPVTGTVRDVHFVFPASVASGASLTLIDLQGKVLKVEQVDPQKGVEGQPYTFALPERLPAGIFGLRLASASQVWVQKFVVTGE
jgi:uncharacterized delta-60 repeat protein